MRCAIIGLGWAADSFHLPALRGTPGVEIVAGCDTDAGRRDRFAAKTGAPAYETAAELLERSRPDAVVVATPPESHRALCLEALAAGAHVICEKPFVRDRRGRRRGPRGRGGGGPAGRDQSPVPREADLPGGPRPHRDGGRRAARVRPVHPAHGSRAVGRAGSVAAGDAEPDALRGRRAPRRPHADPDRRAARRGVRALAARASTGARGRRRDPPRPARVPRRAARADHDRPPLQGRDAVRRAPRRLRARVAARLVRRAGAHSRRASSGRSGPRSGSIYGLGGVAWLERGTARKTIARNPRHPEIVATADALREDPRGVRGGPRAALERARGADGARGDRGRLPLGRDGRARRAGRRGDGCRQAPRACDRTAGGRLVGSSLPSSRSRSCQQSARCPRDGEGIPWRVGGRRPRALPRAAASADPSTLAYETRSHRNPALLELPLQRRAVEQAPVRPCAEGPAPAVRPDEQHAVRPEDPTQLAQRHGSIPFHDVLEDVVAGDDRERRVGEGQQLRARRPGGPLRARGPGPP